MNNIASPIAPASPATDNLDAVRASIAHLLDADNPNPADPHYSAYLDYLERIEALTKATQQSQARGHADDDITDKEAQAVKKLSGLIAGGAEYIEIHTKEAYRAFTGRKRAPDNSYERIVGARKAAAALRVLFLMTARDNPYADWGLISISKQIDKLDLKFDQAIKTFEHLMKSREKRGIHYVVLQSQAPQKIDLGFRSPYGYAIAELLARFDYLVRLIKSLQQRAVLTDDQASKEVRDITRNLRRLFLSPLRFEGVLLQDHLLALSRKDFLPGADEAAAKRATAIKAIFGDVPQDILLGRLEPKHSRNRTTLSPEELHQLSHINDVPIDTDPNPSVERALV